MTESTVLGHGDPRTALVTGGSRGIGRACVSALASLGHHVVAVGRDERALDDVGREADAAGWCVRLEKCDITNEEAVADLLARLPDLDILVNNAGIARSAPLKRTTVADLTAQFAVNVEGAFLCTRAAAPRMVERGWGRIVFVGSVSGMVGLPYTTAYTVSKHAVVGLGRAVASELTGTGVTSNIVCPTFVRSDMTNATIERIVEKTGRSAMEAAASLTGSTALGRLVEPEEVAAAVAYLCHDLSGAINGQTLVIDGGDLQS